MDMVLRNAQSGEEINVIASVRNSDYGLSTKLFRAVRTREEYEALSRLGEWVSPLQMRFNVGKYKVMYIVAKKSLL